MNNMKKERLSVHVATKNRAGELYGLLASLYNQSFKEWDLIIVDESDVSSLNAKYNRDILRRMRCEGHCVKYYQNDLRKGIANVRNLCIKNDDLNNLCVRIDDDSILDINYLNELKKTYDYSNNRKWSIAAVGGIVPVLGAPEFNRELKKEIFNEIIFDIKKKNITITDDGGYSYSGDDGNYVSHHLRSSFLFRKDYAKEVDNFSIDIGGMIGWREETDFCMKLIQKGYKLITNAQAKCWHQQASYGGARTPDYAVTMRINENHFQKKWLREHKLGRIDREKFTIKE